MSVRSDPDATAASPDHSGSRRPVLSRWVSRILPFVCFSIVALNFWPFPSSSLGINLRATVTTAAPVDGVANLCVATDVRSEISGTVRVWPTVWSNGLLTPVYSSAAFTTCSTGQPQPLDSLRLGQRWTDPTCTLGLVFGHGTLWAHRMCLAGSLTAHFVPDGVDRHVVVARQLECLDPRG